MSGTYLDRMKLQRPASVGRRVAVICSGPVSLVVAIKLALAGVDATVFELQPDVGGVLRYGIPEYRLLKSFVSKYRDCLDDLGVCVRPNTTIGESLRTVLCQRETKVTICRTFTSVPSFVTCCLLPDARRNASNNCPACRLLQIWTEQSISKAAFRG